MGISSPVSLEEGPFCAMVLHEHERNHASDLDAIAYLQLSIDAALSINNMGKHLVLYVRRTRADDISLSQQH